MKRVSYKGIEEFLIVFAAVSFIAGISYTILGLFFDSVTFVLGGGVWFFVSFAVFRGLEPHAGDALVRIANALEELSQQNEEDGEEDEAEEDDEEEQEPTVG